MAVIATAISAIVAAMTDNDISSVEWVNVGIAAVTAAAVFAAPNVPGAKTTKAILAVLMAVLSFFVTAISDGVTMSEWLQVIVIASGALGVYAVPNRGPVAVREV